MSAKYCDVSQIKFENILSSFTEWAPAPASRYHYSWEWSGKKSVMQIQKIQEIHELIYLVSLVDGKAVLIYSSIDKHTGWSRPCGHDRVRFFLVKSATLKPLGCELRFNRSESDVNLFPKKMYTNIEEVFRVINKFSDKKCSQCGARFVLKIGRFGYFQGCPKVTGAENKDQHDPTLPLWGRRVHHEELGSRFDNFIESG